MHAPVAHQLDMASLAQGGVAAGAFADTSDCSGIEVIASAKSDGPAAAFNPAVQGVVAILTTGRCAELAAYAGEHRDNLVGRSAGIRVPTAQLVAAHAAAQTLSEIGFRLEVVEYRLGG